MPALRRPTEVLEVEGGRTRIDRSGEPQAGGVGGAPDHLSEEKRGIWDEVVAACAPGVFQSSDRVFIESMVGLICRMRYDPANFGTTSLSVLIGLLARAGMTPADRSKVYVAPSAPDGKPKTGLASFRRG